MIRAIQNKRLAEMAEIIVLDVITKHDIPAERMLRNIADGEPEHAFVITWPKDGGVPSYHSSTADTPVVLMRLREFEHKLFSGEFEP
jgi:hypothetical protein